MTTPPTSAPPGDDHVVTYDSAADVARRIRALPTPVLIAFDCDGVLAPLVDHADDATLLDGVADLLSGLVAQPDTTVAVISGRSLEGLAQFDFAGDIIVVGSHGAERRHRATPALTDDEAARLAQLDALAVDACEVAGEGAWIERKPAGVVVHVVQADPERGVRALASAAAAADEVAGAVTVPGRAVMELLARSTDKGTALAALRSELGVASAIYFGDDVTDEHAFGVLGSDDVGVKIGPAPTAARMRLADPDAVRAILEIIAGTR